MFFKWASGEGGIGSDSAEMNAFRDGLGQQTSIPKDLAVLAVKNWHVVKIMSSPAIKEFGGVFFFFPRKKNSNSQKQS